MHGILFEIPTAGEEAEARTAWGGEPPCVRQGWAPLEHTRLPDTSATILGHGRAPRPCPAIKVRGCSLFRNSRL